MDAAGGQGAVNEGSVLLTLLDGDTWTVKDAFEGTQIFGATGSGKSSGSGRTLAIQALKAGMGGLVLTAKADERQQWIDYAKAAGRSRDIVVLSPSSGMSFGFFEYERQIAEAEGLPITEPVVNLFSVLFEVSQRKGSGGGQEGYWLLAVRQLVRNAVELLLAASLPITFENLYSLITSAPVKKDISDEMLDSIAIGNVPEGLFADAISAIFKAERSAEAHSLMQLTLSFWTKEYVNLAPETRSSIVSYFSGIADVFTRGTLRQLFSPATTKDLSFVPELSRAGKILIFDLPVKRYFETGQMAQVLYKYIWQRAAERQAAVDADVRPMFLWADEAQFFVNSYDMMFQTTARSAKVATFYLTQNISNYYAVMPGDRSKAETDSLLGNFNTKIFHANSDAVTNTWASDLIAKDWQFRQSLSSSVSTAVNDPAAQNVFSIRQIFAGSSRGSTTNVNRSKNEVLEYQVKPLDFSRLLKGGPNPDREKHGRVEAIFTQGGRVLKNDKIFQKLNFIQNLKS